MGTRVEKTEIEQLLIADPIAAYSQRARAEVVLTTIGGNQEKERQA